MISYHIAHCCVICVSIKSQSVQDSAEVFVIIADKSIFFLIKS